MPMMLIDGRRKFIRSDNIKEFYAGAQIDELLAALRDAGDAKAALRRELGRLPMRFQERKLTRD